MNPTVFPRRSRLAPTRLPVLLLSCAMSCMLAGCGDDHGHPHGNTGGTPPADSEPGGHAGGHTERTLLGKAAIGSHIFRVFKVAPITPGQEGDFDLDFAAEPLPGTVRGWVGIESGVGSVKAMFRKETATRMHGHPEIPDPLPEGSAVWIEIEGAGSTSVPIGG